jgi:hypothetical protein
MSVFWVVAPCSLVDVYRRFRGACCLHNQGESLQNLRIIDTTTDEPKEPPQTEKTTKKYKKLINNTT